MLSSAPYNFSNGQVGLVYVSALVGSVFGWLAGVFGDWIIVYLARRNGGVKEPEMRLWALTPCFIFTLLGYLIYGWGPQEGAHWMTVAVGIGGMIAQQVAATSTVCLPSRGLCVMAIIDRLVRIMTDNRQLSRQRRTQWRAFLESGVKSSLSWRSAARSSTSSFPRRFSTSSMLLGMDG